MRGLQEGQGLNAIKAKIDHCVQSARDARLTNAGRTAQRALFNAQAWLQAAAPQGQPALEAGARRFAMTLGRALSLALLVEHGQWSLDYEQDGRGRAAALRFAASHIDLITEMDAAHARALANDEPLAV